MEEWCGTSATACPGRVAPRNPLGAQPGLAVADEALLPLGIAQALDHRVGVAYRLHSGMWGSSAGKPRNQTNQNDKRGEDTNGS